ncbi:MAG: thermonuclease family protein [Gemmatimonadaceae bacterium]
MAAALLGSPLRAQQAAAPPRPPRPEPDLSRLTADCMLMRVVDGDGIVCQGLGDIRLIGIDAPELQQQPDGRAARAVLDSLLRGGALRLERDRGLRDRYGRLLVYVWRDSTLVNWEMVLLGYAVPMRVRPNVRYADYFTDAAAHAQAEGRGLWATSGFRCAPADRRRRRC